MHHLKHEYFYMSCQCKFHIAENVMQKFRNFTQRLRTNQSIFTFLWYEKDALVFAFLLHYFFFVGLGVRTWDWE
jgi:hypothetical protein